MLSTCTQDFGARPAAETEAAGHVHALAREATIEHLKRLIRDYGVTAADLKFADPATKGRQSSRSA